LSRDLAKKRALEIGAQRSEKKKTEGEKEEIADVRTFIIVQIHPEEMAKKLPLYEQKEATLTRGIHNGASSERQIVRKKLDNSTEEDRDKNPPKRPERALS